MCYGTCDICYKRDCPWRRCHWYEIDCIYYKQGDSNYAKDSNHINACGNQIPYKTATPWLDESCTKHATTEATTIKTKGTTIATLFVKTTNDCPSDKQGLGGCYPGSDFLKNQIASNTGLAQTAEWTDQNLKFVVGTMADQIVATIC